MSARPSDRFAIAIAQLNSTVGDIDGNAATMRSAQAKPMPVVAGP